MSRTSSRRVRAGVGAGVATGVLALLAGALQPVPALAAPAPGAAPAAALPAPPALHWTPCRDGFQCTTAKVPLDHDRPAGPTISLSLIRLPAAGAPERRLGSLFVNPGGPGGSGVDAVRYIGPAAPLEVRARYDIVGFDPRGIIRSTPMRCFDTFDEAIATLPPFAFPVTTAEENRQRRSDRALSRACARDGGRIRDHMSTADVARDLDLLRRAVGDRKLNFLGYSYGSMIGSTYANLFPATTGRLVVDGVIDPVAWTSGGRRGTTVPVTTRIRSGDGAQDTLGEFFRLCDAAGEDCAFSGDSQQRYADLAARLRRAPLVIGRPPEQFRFTYADLVGSTLGVLYAPFIWPDFAAFLAELEAEVSAARVAAAADAVRSALGVQGAAQEPYPNYVEGFVGVLCADSTNPTSFDAWRQAADRTDRRGYFGRPWTFASSICLSWPDSAKTDRYAGPWNARTATTVLVVGNRYDPATPYSGAVAVSRLLPNSRLLTYTGWGHTAYLTGSFCVDRAVTSYLVAGRVPQAGAQCRPEGSPFGPTEAPRALAASSVVARTLPAPVRRGVEEALAGR